MILSSLATTFRRVRAANTTDNSLPTLSQWWSLDGLHPGRDGAGNQVANAGVAQGEGPLVGGYIFPQPGLNGELPNAIMLMPIGTDAENETFLMRVLGYSRYQLAESDPRHVVAYVTQVLGQFTCTLGTPVGAGASGDSLGSGQRFADTIEIASGAGNDDVSIDRFSPANNIPAHVILDIKSCQTLRVDFSTENVAASCNALYRWLY